jgi:hypothetical protein
VYEVFGVGVVFLGAILLFVGILWLIRNAWQTRKSLGVLTFLTALIGPLVFGLFRFRHNKRALLIVLIGMIVGTVPFAADRAYEFVFGLSGRERIIDGERYLTLTGWDRNDYRAVFSRYSDVAVLEMGNRDVTDETLKSLIELPKLKELTLSDTPITDEGLEALAKRPALESFRLQRTKITKEGVTAFLSAPPSKLIEIDVSGNSIPASALRKWKNVDPEHRRYVN